EQHWASLFNHVQDTKDDWCQKDESIFFESYKYKLEGNTWYDTYRCHDVPVLHWLVSMGYKSLATNVSTPISGSLLTDQGLPPRERTPLEESTTWFLNVWNGNKTILDMFQNMCCYNVVTLFPEGYEQHLS
ncbi:MAG: hypothetical protein ACKPKO_45885, partial [Candidatus Fonsibacter sp.]